MPPSQSGSRLGPSAPATSSLRPRSMSTLAIRSTNPCRDGAVVGLGRQVVVPVGPELAHDANALGVVHERRPMLDHRVHTVHHHTPNSAATRDTARASSPTSQHASVHTRRVSHRLGVDVRWPRSPSWSRSSSAQRHRRLTHRGRAGPPKQPRSRRSIVTRPLASASTPQSQ